MSIPLRVAAFASSKSPQQNLQEEEVTSSGQGLSQGREGREGRGEEEEAPWESAAQRYQYVELDDEDVEAEMVLGGNKGSTFSFNQMNNNPGGVKEEKKEDFKKIFPVGMEGALPRNVEMEAGARVRIKGKKQFFHCDLCHVQLSSEETMTSHVTGTPHCKKLKVEEKAHRDKIAAGLIPADEPLQEFVRQIPVPVSAKTKVPKRLQERIKDSEEPIIGLQFITEILPESDPQMEPHYECEGKIYSSKPLNLLKLSSQMMILFSFKFKMNPPHLSASALVWLMLY